MATSECAEGNPVAELLMEKDRPEAGSLTLFSPLRFLGQPLLVKNRFFWAQLFFGLFFAGALFSLFAFYWMGTGTIQARGGFYFGGSCLFGTVPPLAQNDPKWSDLPLANTAGSLGREGCALTCAAMVLSHYGFATDPAALNNFLCLHQGYTAEGWIYWEKAALYSRGQLAKAYEGPASYALLDWNLLCGTPVIARLMLPNGHTHFVVIVGKSGWNYLVEDPAQKQRGIYPLYELTDQITGLRIIRPVTLKALALEQFSNRPLQNSAALISSLPWPGDSEARSVAEPTGFCRSSVAQGSSPNWELFSPLSSWGNSSTRPFTQYVPVVARN